MICLCCVASIILGLLRQNQSENSSIYAQVISKPTGANAYEDYCQAADLISGSELQVYLDWKALNYDYYKTAYEGLGGESNPAVSSEFRVAKSLKGDTFLQVMAAASARYQPALDIVRQALRKPVWQPRAKFDSKTLFPEYLCFKRLERLFCADAYVNFAAGRSDLGAQDLIDGIRFAEHMPAGPIVSPLVYQSMELICFSGINQNLGSIPLDAWQQIADLCDARLSTNALVVDSINLEAKAISNDIRALVSTELQESGQVPSSELPGLLKDAQTYAVNYYKETADRFNGPEEDWQTTPPWWSGAFANLPKNPTQQDLLSAVLDGGVPDMADLANTFSRMRTEWRILRLTALVEIYRWHHSALPSKILMAATAEDLADPFSGGKLVYDLLPEGGFKIYSKGTAQSGQVELAGHRQA